MLVGRGGRRRRGRGGRGSDEVLFDKRVSDDLLARQYLVGIGVRRSVELRRWRRCVLVVVCCCCCCCRCLQIGAAMMRLGQVRRRRMMMRMMRMKRIIACAYDVDAFAIGGGGEASGQR